MPDDRTRESLPASVWEENITQLRQIAKAFYQAHQMTGTVSMRFGMRTLPDSDGNSVVDVYVCPCNQEAAKALKQEDNARHMQFLENMVPASLLGYEFMIRIEPRTAYGTDPENEIDMHVLQICQPQTFVGTTGPGLTS